jgi:hypothetical protein
MEFDFQSHFNYKFSNQTYYLFVVVTVANSCAISRHKCWYNHHVAISCE